MVASHGFVMSQVSYGRARQRTATSMNPFAMEYFLSRKSCVGVGAAGKGSLTPMASFCFSDPRDGFWGGFCGCGVLTIEREKEREMVASVTVGCWPMERAA